MPINYRDINANSKAITYRDLKAFLNGLSEDQLDCDVTIGVADKDIVATSGADLEIQSDFEQVSEFYACYIWGVMIGSDVLDDQHPYLGIVI